MINTSVLGLMAAAFVAGSFIASPELRAYAANTVKSIDIVDGEVKTPDLANNAVTSIKIKDGEVKAADIGTDQVKAAEIAANAVGASEIVADSVTASELVGVTKLTFVQCTVTDNTPRGPGTYNKTCGVRGTQIGDSVLATKNQAIGGCYELHDAAAIGTDVVQLTFVNECAGMFSLGTVRIAVLVYDT